MFGRKLKLALAAVFSLAATAAYLEGTGYALFDRADGTNVLCDADPTCRYLTEGEINIARQVYGDEIDYSTVKVFNRSYYLSGPVKGALGLGGTAETPNGNIYIVNGAVYTEDFSAQPQHAALFIHEMGHVWQAQGGRNLVWEAISAYVSSGRNYSSIYSYESDMDKPYAAFNLEQQAEMAEDYWNLRTQYAQSARPQDWAAYRCGKIKELETKLSEELPVTVLAPCQAYALNN